MQPDTTAQQNGSAMSAGSLAMAAVIERVIIWVGSPASLLVHTIAFIVFFGLALFGLVHWDTMLLVLTTIVSLEAIYLAIFIQFSVNRQAASLKGVEEDVESIQEDVEELGEHVEDIKEDVEEIQEDIGEISEDATEQKRKRTQAETLETLTNDVKAMLRHLEELKAD
jgi:uncharacterized membrane protein